VPGRKRVALVDAEGNWLAIAVVPASLQDHDTLPASDAGNTNRCQSRNQQAKPAQTGSDYSL